MKYLYLKQIPMISMTFGAGRILLGVELVKKQQIFWCLYSGVVRTKSYNRRWKQWLTIEVYLLSFIVGSKILWSVKISMHCLLNNKKQNVEMHAEIYRVRHVYMYSAYRDVALVLNTVVWVRECWRKVPLRHILHTAQKPTYGQSEPTKISCDVTNRVS